uniref:F-box domain-containing protein n=1 Tax=Steinernema glaseri TaxID=37863 RepID=A0A1I8AVY5_9BILA
MSRQDASVPQSDMASVPFAFLESVCATLGKASLRTVRFLPDDPSWSSVARKIEDETRDFELSVNLFGPEDVSYNCSISLEEARKAKYLRCSRLENYLGNLDENTDWKVTLHTLLSAVQIEGFYLFHTDLRSVEDYFSPINPWYLRAVDICYCDFTSDVSLCTWLKKVVANKCLSSLRIYYTSFAKPMEPKLDLNEELYGVLVHQKRLEYIAIHDNDSIEDLKISFFRRVLDFWVASENGFQRGLTLFGPSKLKRQKKKVKTLYHFGEGNQLLHASGRESVNMSYSDRRLLLTFWPARRK